MKRDLAERRRFGPARVIAAVWIVAGSAWSIEARAAPQGETTRYYLMSFRDQPIEDVARTVLGETLTHPYRLDPSVEGEVTFAVDGSLDEAGLLRAFAVALAEEGVAIDDADGMLVLRPMTAPAATPRADAVGERPRPVYGRAPAAEPEGGGFGAFAVGAVSGAFGLAAILAFAGWSRRRRARAEPAPTPLALEAPPPPDPLEALPPMPERRDVYSR